MLDRSINSINRILIIKGSSQYDVMRYVCDAMQQAFINCGCEADMIDLERFSYNDTSLASLSSYDMFFSFDVVGIDLYNTLKNKPFFWSFLVDPPFYLHERLKQIDGNVLISCVDKRHVDYIDRYYSNIPWTCFMPHGGVIYSDPLMIPYDKRRYDVVMLGSLHDPCGINDIIRALKNDYDPLISTIIDKCITDNSIELNDAFLDTVNEYGLDFDTNMCREFMYIIRSIDALRRYNKRISLIRSLLEQGISVDIWGNGWEIIKEYDTKSLIQIHKCVDYISANRIMSDARILLNDMPFFHNGSHERVFAAMQSGSIVATDRSLFLCECFEDTKEILYYDHDKIEELAKAVTNLINDNNSAENIVSNGIRSSAAHTWQNRASAILSISSELIS